jgi:hypothetical protein
MRFLRRFFIRLSNFTAGRRADRWHWTREVKVPQTRPNRANKITTLNQKSCDWGSRIWPGSHRIAHRLT